MEKTISLTKIEQTNFTFRVKKWWQPSFGNIPQGLVLVSKKDLVPLTRIMEKGSTKNFHIHQTNHKTDEELLEE